MGGELSLLGMLGAVSKVLAGQVLREKKIRGRKSCFVIDFDSKVQIFVLTFWNKVKTT